MAGWAERAWSGPRRPTAKAEESLWQHRGNGGTILCLRSGIQPRDGVSIIIDAALMVGGFHGSTKSMEK
jgi:hypothetical protein